MANHREEVVSRRTARGQPSSGLQPLSPEEFTMPFFPGQVVSGKYEIIELIGVGGIGFVVAATHVELGDKVALKFLRPEALANSEAVGRFAREARASAQIKSEHVVRVFDVGNLPDGAPFIVMEHLEGKDLDAVMHELGALPVKLAVEYVLQACEALAAAHARGIIHRDVKPENLFLNHRAQGMDIIKVLDFGISKVAFTGSAFESRHPLVRTTMAMGSPIYMSPEQIRASQDIDARTDIWSLGCVLYELLTGNPAFDAPSLTQVAAIIIEKEPAPLELVCPLAPPGLAAIVMRCLAKSPAARFQDVAELAVALHTYGPQRGRVSVERCCSLLRSAGMSKAELSLPSVFPPSLSDLSSAAPSRPMASTPLPDSSVTLAAVSTRSNKVRMALAFAALAAVLYLVVAVRNATQAPTTVTAPTLLGAPATAELTPAQAAVPPTPAPREPAAVPAARGPESADSVRAEAPSPTTTKPSASASAPAPAKRRSSAPAPKPKAPVARPAPTTVAGEPDIGF
jgi:eukaryotic-like serine/threonine-protein kinase